MSKRITKEDFIVQAMEIHGNKYDYSFINFINKSTKVNIKCNTCQEMFEQTPHHHINRKQGCKKCAGCFLDTKMFIEQAIKLHGNLYDYSLVEYIGAYVKIKIICKTHGIFEQVPHGHLMGKGCLECGGRKPLNTEIFIKRSKNIHINEYGLSIYDYSLAYYINNTTKVKIICLKHGVFEQSPNKHINSKHGCPDCPHIVSKPEIEWLNSFSIKKEYRQFVIKIGKLKFKVDGYDPITNTVYEFNGDYYHGNPKLYPSDAINTKSKKTFGELFAKTLEKERVLKSANYNVISIWESDWNQQQKEQCQKK